MEELLVEFDINEIDEIKYGKPKFKFPVAYVGGDFVYFNIYCKPLLGETIKWFTTSEYVIALPAEKEEVNSFCVRDSRGYGNKVAFLPVRLAKEKRLQCGYYKVYKYKNGLAFKRYERIEMSK